MEKDWQINFTKVKNRNQYLLQSEKLADCRFLVGPSWNQSLIAGHRLLLAMASPVFGRMFYGYLQEKDDPIVIPDVQPDAFKAMLKYIYTDEISISSFDHGCELYYLAKKYMMPHVLKHCKNFLLSDISAKNACRAYEFGKLYEEPRLIESSMQHITINTRQVIADPSFMDIEVSTLSDILDQNRLNIDSELDLFNCLLKLANERGILKDGDKDNKNDDGNENASDVVVVEENKLQPDNSNSGADSTSVGTCGNLPKVADDVVVVDSHASRNANGSEYANDVVVEEIKLESEDSNSGAPSLSTGTCSNVPNVADEVVEVDSIVPASGNASESEANMFKIMDAQFTTKEKALIRQAVKKIRFLAMTPEQFAKGPGRSKLLKQSEAFAILTKLVCPTINDCPMPEGFSQSCKRRKLERYCVRTCPIFKTESTDLESFLYFHVGTNIYLLGLQIQLKSSRLRNDIKGFSAHIENSDDIVIASTSTIGNRIDSMIELTFNSPVFVHGNKNYYIKLVNLLGHTIVETLWKFGMVRNGVSFSILPVNRRRRGLGSTLCGIVYSTEQDLSSKSCSIRT